MDIEQLKIFLAVYRLKGISAVADQLNLASSSVSRSLAALEAQLDTRLFHRTTRKVTATEAGEKFYHQIFPLIEELEFTFSELKETKKTLIGKIRLTCSVSFGQIVIVPLLKEFKERYPHIDLELILSDRNLDLIDDRIDLAIRHGELNDSSLVIRKLMNTKYHIVASPEYLANSSLIENPEDITNHSIVSFAMQDLQSEWELVNEREIKLIKIKPNLVISNASAIKDCAKNGLGLALLADWTIQADLINGSLMKILPEWQVMGVGLGNRVWLVLPSKSFVPKKTKVLSDFLIEKIQ